MWRFVQKFMTESTEYHQQMRLDFNEFICQLYFD